MAVKSNILFCVMSSSCATAMLFAADSSKSIWVVSVFLLIYEETAGRSLFSLAPRLLGYSRRRMTSFAGFKKIKRSQTRKKSFSSEKAETFSNTIVVRNSVFLLEELDLTTHF